MTDKTQPEETVEVEAKPTFDGLGIYPELLKRLTDLGFMHPTPIQHAAIPVGTKGEDMIGIAQTGTLAFSIPMIQRISETKGMGLILLPTRELALQVEEILKKVGQAFGMRTAVLIGGASMYPQVKDLKNKPHIIVATPGRLIDHIEQRNVSLSNIRILVLDEADRMLDMGFEPQIKKILGQVPKERQTMLFSATMPSKISQIGEMYMKKPLRIEIAPQGTTADRIEQEIFMVKKEDKIRLLETILEEYKGTILVFSRTKHGAKKIMNAVVHMNHTAAELHSNKSLAQRKLALAGFKSGKVRVLVATDIASRGIDVTNIELVINFDLPEQTEDYVHRIGRTGRAGRSGKAISFVTSDQRNDLKMIERLIKSKLTVKQLPELPERRIIPEPPHERSHHGGNGGGRFRDSRPPYGDRRSQRSQADRFDRPSRGGLQSGFSSTIGENPSRTAKNNREPRLFTGAPTPNAPRGPGRFSNARPAGDFRTRAQNESANENRRAAGHSGDRRPSSGGYQGHSPKPAGSGHARPASHSGDFKNRRPAQGRGKFTGGKPSPSRNSA